MAQRQDIPGFNRPAGADPSLPDFLFGTYAGGLNRAQGENQQRAQQYIRDNNLNPRDFPGATAMRSSVQVPPQGKPQQTQQSRRGKFPEHWSKPPGIFSTDYVELPGGYGKGSSTTAKWIQENLDRDQQSPPQQPGIGLPDQGLPGSQEPEQPTGQAKPELTEWQIRQEEQVAKFRKDTGLDVQQASSRDDWFRWLDNQGVGLPWDENWRDNLSPEEKSRLEHRNRKLEHQAGTKRRQKAWIDAGNEFPQAYYDLIKSADGWSDWRPPPDFDSITNPPTELLYTQEGSRPNPAFKEWTERYPDAPESKKYRDEQKRPIERPSVDDPVGEPVDDPVGEPIGLPDSGTPVADEEPAPEQPPQREFVIDPSKPTWAREINGEIISGLQQAAGGDWFNKDGQVTSDGRFVTWDKLGFNPNNTAAQNFGQEYADAFESYKEGGLNTEELKSLRLLQDKHYASQGQAAQAQAQAAAQQQTPPGLSQQEWQGMAAPGAQDYGGHPGGGGQQSMMDLWGGGGQQAPTQQWGDQQGWQIQEQGQTFQDPITGRTLDTRTGQPVQDHGGERPSGYQHVGVVSGNISKNYIPEGWVSFSDLSPSQQRALTDQYGGGNVGYVDPNIFHGGQQQGGGYGGYGGSGGMGNMFPGIQFPDWATLPDPNLAGQIQQPIGPGLGTGQPGQNIPGAGVIPGLPPVSPIPGAAPELGQYGQEIGEAATAKLQQAPQSGVPSGSPVVYPSSQAIAPTTRQVGGGRRGSGGASPFSYGVRVQ